MKYSFLHQHAEPSLDEFLPVETQLELENRQREEEDAMYRRFLQVNNLYIFQGSLITKG